MIVTGLVGGWIGLWLGVVLMVVQARVKRALRRGRIDRLEARIRGEVADRLESGAVTRDEALRELKDLKVLLDTARSQL